MKPSDHLQRRTPLQRKTRLKSGKGLQRRRKVPSPEVLERRLERQRQRSIQSPLRPRPVVTGTSKRGSRAGESRARRLVKARSGGLCEIRMDEHCSVRATDFHHRKRRSQGGLWCPANGLAVCRHCHEAVTNTRGNLAEYERRGWCVPSHKRPVDVAVDRSGQWVQLDTRGGPGLAGAA